MKINDEFLKRTKDYFKDKSDDFIKTLDLKPTRGLFLNTVKADKETILSLIDFEYFKSNLNSNAYYHEFDSIGKTIVNELGLIYPQDVESSYSSTFINDPNINLIVDLCSAPGGKSINIINKYKDATVICNDVNSKRANELSKNLERLGLTNTIITSKKPEELVKCLKGNVELVILDAPCSGEGIIRKYPEILDTYSVSNINNLSDIQKGLLENAYELVKENGYILYSTCTYALEEDEKQVINFLSAHDDIELIKLNSPYNYSQLDGTIKLCPLNNTEGQFIALFKRRSSNEQVRMKYFKPIRNKIVEDFIHSNLNISEYFLYEVNGNYYLSFKPLFDLNGGVIRSYIHIGEVVKNRFEPSHCLYRSSYLKDCFLNTYDLTFDEYNNYIKGLELKINKNDGYYLLTYKNISLGYGKLSKGILKNKYPKGLRRQ